MYDECKAEWLKHNPKEGFFISRELWDAIAKALRPGWRTLEAGSGLSTLLFDRMGVEHYALEQSKRWADTVLDCTTTAGVYYCEVKNGWYEPYPKNGPFDLILLDGPRGGGRLGFLDHADKLIGDNTIVFVDDVNRLGERELVKRLCEEFNLAEEPHEAKPGRNYAKLAPRKAESTERKVFQGDRKVDGIPQVVEKHLNRQRADEHIKTLEVQKTQLSSRERWDVEKLGGPFNVVTCMNISKYDRPWCVLRQIRRALVPGGLVYLRSAFTELSSNALLEWGGFGEIETGEAGDIKYAIGRALGRFETLKPVKREKIALAERVSILENRLSELEKRHAD